MHPRLLSTLVLFEPAIIEEHDGGPGPAIMATTRRDIWDTRVNAEASLRKAFSTWEPRAMEKFLKHGLRQVPTALYSLNQEGMAPNSVTLTTSKHQEAWAYSQINFEPQEDGLDRLILPDWHQPLGYRTFHSARKALSQCRTCLFFAQASSTSLVATVPYPHLEYRIKRLRVRGQV